MTKVVYNPEQSFQLSKVGLDYYNTLRQENNLPVVSISNIIDRHDVHLVKTVEDLNLASIAEVHSDEYSIIIQNSGGEKVIDDPSLVADELLSSAKQLYYNNDERYNNVVNTYAKVLVCTTKINSS